uniref:Tudor domain-containing protein n=1 Tax=Strongyloides venezuelensis TaxID=75913 RepID=A0A0K0FNB9_STRVS
MMNDEVLEKFGFRGNCIENFILGNKYTIPYLTIPQHAYFKVVKVISPSLIFIKFLNDVTGNLNESINIEYHKKFNIEEKFYYNMENLNNNVCEGFLYRYCLAPINDKEYGRGRIIKEALQLTDSKTLNSKKFVKIFFIDTAEESWFSIDSLYELPVEKYLTPWQIAPISLYGIIPSTKKNINYWNENICKELSSILKDIIFVEVIKKNCGRVITPVQMIVYSDSNRLVGEDIGVQLFCKFPLEIDYTQYSPSTFVFNSYNKILNNEKKNLFDDNVPFIKMTNNIEEQGNNDSIIFEEKDDIKIIKCDKIKEKKQYYEIKPPVQTTLGVLSFNSFLNCYKNFNKIMDEANKFCSPQIPNWTKSLLQKFNYIGPDNKMYVELLPFEETPYGEEIVKNPLELHGALLRYQPEDVVIREDILYNTLELEYYSERLALQNKLNFYYSQPGNLCPLNQDEVVRDLNKGYCVYGIYFTINDYGILIANRVEILAVDMINDAKNNLDENELLDLENMNNEENFNEEDFDIFKTAKIRFLDYGGIVTVSVKMLSKIHTQFCFLPPFSIQINLIPLTKKIYSIATEENREFILKYYDYFNAAVDLKTPMLAIFDSHQGTLRKKRNENYVAFFENNCEWEYNHVINVSSMQRLFPRGIPIDMTIDSYLNFLENTKEDKVSDVDEEISNNIVSKI